MQKKSLWFTFLPLWILANTAGWYMIMSDLLTPFKLATLWSAAFILGLLQWAVLGKYLGVDWRWALAGIPVYGSLNTAVYFNADFIQLMFLEVLFLGLLGLLQYAVLNEYVDGAMTWIFISPFAGFLGLAFSYPGAKSFGQAWTIHGTVYGIITGLALVVLMTRPAKVTNEVN